MKTTFTQKITVSGMILFIAGFITLVVSGFETKKVDAAEQYKPNILFIAVDDLKPILGCYGDTIVKTPHIDAIADSGITFVRNYCQQAVCAPSRASLLTGRYPDQLRVWDLKTVIREKNPGIVTLPQYFKQQGYQTAATGKIFDPRSLEGSWGGPHDAPSWTIDYTYPGDFYNSQTGSPEYYYASTIAKDTIRKLQAEARNRGMTSYNDIRNYVRQYYWPPVESADVPYDAYIDGAHANHGMHLMETLAGKDEPFFLAVGFHRPHLPFNAPTEYWDLYSRDNFKTATYQKKADNSPDIAYHNSGELRNGYTGVPDGNFPEDYQKELIHGYYAATSYIDDMVGLLLKKLDELGLSENTIVVLWGDHGWHLGDHGLWCKHSNFEQATRAPLIMKTPWQKKKGGKHEGPTEFTDIAPTLCDLAGIKIPVYFEGENLSPLFDDPEPDLRTAALSQYPRNGKKYMGYSIRTKRYRYTKWIETASGETYASELYDYEVDSMETTSFIHDPAYSSVLNTLDSIVDERISIPSTQPKIQFHVYGKTNDENVYPLANSRVQLDGYEHTTNDSGILTLTHPEGVYNYSLIKQGYSGANLNISLESDTVIIDTLTALQNQVRLKIIDDHTGDNIDSCLLRFGEDTVYAYRENPLFFSNLHSGFYDLSVKKKHYNQIDKLLYIFSDSTIEVRLKKKLYLIQVEVIDDQTEEKLSAAAITHDSVTKTTNLEGFVQFRLPHDNYVFMVEKDQYRSFTDTFWLNSDTALMYTIHKTLGDITFEVSEGETPVNDVKVVCNGDTAITNNLGMTTCADLELDTTYSFQLFRNNYLAQTHEVFLTSDTTLSLQFVKTAMDAHGFYPNVRMHPNPVRDRLVFEPASAPAFIEIRSITGRILYRAEHPGTTFHIDISGLPNGMYVVRIAFEKNRFFTQKICIL